MEEENGLVEDVAKTQDWEHAASVAIDGCYIAVWNARRNCKFTRSQVKTLEVLLKKAQEKIAKCGGLIAECKGQLRDVGLVQIIEYNIWHSKFAAADTLIRWVGENPARVVLPMTLLSVTLRLRIKHTPLLLLNLVQDLPVWQVSVMQL